GLYDGNSTSLPGLTNFYPLTFNTTAGYSGSYYLRIEGMSGRFGYAVSLSKSSSNCGAGPCPDLIASGEISGASINSLGEIVWGQADQANVKQLYSSIRQQLPGDPGRSEPAINNLGDLIWTEYVNVNFQNSYLLKGTIAGQPVTLATSQSWFGGYDSNDRGEVVWAQRDPSGQSQIYSNLRGQLTNDASNYYNPKINNLGDVVFISNGATPSYQVYKLAAGTALPVPVTSGSFDHRAPAINDGGKIVWAEQDRYTPGAPTRLVSSNNETLLTTPADINSMVVDLNNCGDIVYRVDENGQNKLYRLGSSAPCVSYPAAGDQSQAAQVAFGAIFTGLIDSSTTPVNWYRFEAAAGDSIHITVNYDSRPPNMLNIGLYDGNSTSLPGLTNFYPLTFNTTAGYSGSYYLRIEGMSGRFGYAVSLSKSSSNCGAGPCPDLIASGEISGASINSLGEIVWGQADQANVKQLYSSIRQQLPGDPGRSEPAINNLGDLIWTEYVNVNFQNSYLLKGTIAGQPVTLATSQSWFGGYDSNDRGEVVWAQRDPSGQSQIYSNLRGQLTNDAS